MLRGLRARLSYANVMSTIAVFVAVGTGGAYAANTIGTGDIIDNQVTSADVRDDSLGFGGLAAQDLGPGSVRSSEIADGEVFTPDVGDGGLIDRDIAQSGGAHRDFTGNIGTVAAHTCVYRAISGINASRDHLLLTPNFNTASAFLSYTIEYEDAQERAQLKVCNLTGGAINDGTTRFNLIVINGVAL